MNLPKIYKNEINNINNNREIFISHDNNDIDKYPVKVIITTKNNNTFNTTLIGRTNNYLITNTKRTIYINDVKEIKKA